MTDSKKIGVTELVLRDAHQSLLATRFRYSDMESALKDLDNVGFWSVESWGGAIFDSCIRYLGEDPWERIRNIKSMMPNTPQQMLLRGQNLLGYGQDYGKRIVSFFKNEPIVGGFVNSFYLIIIGFLFTQLENQNKKFALIFSIIFLIGILLTGERSNGIKALIGFSIFYLSLKNYDIKKKIGFISELKPAVLPIAAI